MIHDLGIGTRYTTGVLQSTYREQIKAAKDVALANQIWPTEDSDEEVKSWIKELDTEGSLEQEYIASVIDSYYGYWGAYNESYGGMWGVYKAKTRNDIKQKDPLGYQLMKDFLPEFITYTARIDETFTGTFSLSFDKEQLYTYKSQYLLNARLLGNNSSNLVGNAQGNLLIGNAGNNIFDGKEGTDTVQIYGLSKDYSIDVQTDQIIVTHIARQEVDVLKNIEILRFFDVDLMAQDL